MEEQGKESLQGPGPDCTVGGGTVPTCFAKVAGLCAQQCGVTHFHATM